LAQPHLQQAEELLTKAGQSYFVALRIQQARFALQQQNIEQVKLYLDSIEAIIHKAQLEHQVQFVYCKAHLPNQKEETLQALQKLPSLRPVWLEARVLIAYAKCGVEIDPQVGKIFRKLQPSLETFVLLEMTTKNRFRTYAKGLQQELEHSLENLPTGSIFFGTFLERLSV
jgi:hypothetical protein